ncbi:MAG: hypothetical protein KatS3mg131_1045 [Candidatus Tectimicrobiota bacterium]|nr:MAG: hypothetical protein KatS3mg131_1045 [Candidatus Tectomicrobia bacterium]
MTWWQRAGQRLPAWPLLAWLAGALVAAVVERAVGLHVVHALGLPTLPSMFGLSSVFAEPGLMPHTLAYLLLVYLLPAGGVAALLAPWVRRSLVRLSPRLALLVHLGVLYAVFHVWGHTDDYRLLVLRLLGIGIILTTSLNLVNGWMGEFSVSVAGFMAVGAYVSSVLTVWGFVDDDVFGPAVLPAVLAPFAFPLVLVLGGVAAALSALLVAVPSFRTRGDYLAIISLAYVFIVKSALENAEFIGGPRGFMNQPTLASLPVVFVWTLLCVATIALYVTSTYGKATSAVRDNESAAEAVTVDTRRVKVVAFLTHAFWSGIAGGLYAHVIGYINPSNFGLIKSAEVLAMLYLGGLSSVSGSVLGTVLFQLLSEVLRPLKLVKWLVIPVLLILVMVFRPRGLFGFRELRLPFVPARPYGAAGD